MLCFKYVTGAKNLLDISAKFNKNYATFTTYQGAEQIQEIHTTAQYRIV
jgi:hypothetical protein